MFATGIALYLTSGLLWSLGTVLAAERLRGIRVGLSWHNFSIVARRTIFWPSSFLNWAYHYYKFEFKMWKFKQDYGAKAAAELRASLYDRT